MQNFLIVFHLSTLSRLILSFFHRFDWLSFSFPDRCGWRGRNISDRLTRFTSLRRCCLRGKSYFHIALIKYHKRNITPGRCQSKIGIFKGKNLVWMNIDYWKFQTRAFEWKKWKKNEGNEHTLTSDVAFSLLDGNVIWITPKLMLDEFCILYYFPLWC